MAKKKKSKWKKLAKAALIGGALYAGAKGLGKKRKSVEDTAASEAANVGINTKPGLIDAQDAGSKFKFKYPPYDASADKSTYFKKGGRTGKKGGGRIGKQFGGGLGSTARRDMRSGYYPKDMGMRGGTMYKKGGRVKSMGIAKRGGGVAKR